MFVPQKVLSLSPSILVFTLLNTRSLRRHAVDIASDLRLIESDILFLTETQLTDADSVININNMLQNFSIVFNNSLSQHSSLAIAFRDSVEILRHDKNDGISALTFCKPSCCHGNIGVALIYRKNSSTLSSFYRNLEILNNHINLNFILGDFNLDAFNPEILVRLRNILSNFVLLSNKSSHLNGSHIDQVYVRKHILQQSNLNCSIVNVYFSDHDALKVQCQF